MLSFASTTDAMAAEHMLKEHGLPGRIIPVPREITASCGLAWKAPVEAKGEILDAMQREGLRLEAAAELMLV